MPVPIRRLRRGPLVLAVTVLLATACGGTPSRADWVDRMTESVGTDISTAIEDRGLSELETEMVISEFVNCQYDAIRSRSDLVEKSYDDPGDPDIAGDLSTLAQPCIDDLGVTLTDKVDPLPTTTIPEGALPIDPATGQTLPPTTATTIVPPAAFETVPTTVDPAMSTTTVPATTIPTGA